ncbi:tRNA intron endonuclease [Cunninghamella echinulata]|nr:tRNA intron endonuclease [Cunninghamella echinulata]
MANENEIIKQLIRISICGNKPLVFNIKDVKTLRCEHHIVGSLQGTLARFPLQNSFYSLPLLLLPEEVVLLLKKGLGHCVSLEGAVWDYPTTHQEQLKCIVYSYLWHKGYYITCGAKFGGDYLIYPGDPMKFHGHFIVSVQERKSLWQLQDLIVMGRLAKNTKKTFVLASPSITTSSAFSMDHDKNNVKDGGNLDENNDINDNQVECFSIVWAGF